MHKFYRSVLLTGMVAVGLAGASDDLSSPVVAIKANDAGPPIVAPTVKEVNGSIQQNLVSAPSAPTSGITSITDFSVAEPFNLAATDPTIRCGPADANLGNAENVTTSGDNYLVEHPTAGADEGAKIDIVDFATSGALLGLSTSTSQALDLERRWRLQLGAIAVAA